MLLQLKKELFRNFYSNFFFVASKIAIVASVYNKLVVVQL